jgi:hypothetical protein
MARLPRRAPRRVLAFARALATVGSFVDDERIEIATPWLVDPHDSLNGISWNWDDAARSGGSSADAILARVSPALSV